MADVAGVADEVGAEESCPKKLKPVLVGFVWPKSDEAVEPVCDCWNEDEGGAVAVDCPNMPGALLAEGA